MDILLSTDNNYVMPTGVLMTSVSTNNDDVRYHILVDEEFKDENKTLLIKTAQKFNHLVDFYLIPVSDISKCPIGEKGQPGYITIATYYRLFVCQLLPESLHRIIYLDGDMIVRKSLLPLWLTDLTGVALGVVHDMDEDIQIQRMPYPQDDGYFNAGMLLINLDYWRETDCQKRFEDFISSQSFFLKCHDQDVMNCVLHNEKKWVPLTYNFQSGFLFDIPEMKNYVKQIEKEIRSVERNPSIIHFSCTKPWSHNCMHPQRSVWEFYRKKSLWKDVDLSVDMTRKEKLSLFLRLNNFWFFSHRPDSLHRNIYRRVILKK